MQASALAQPQESRALGRLVAAVLLIVPGVALGSPSAIAAQEGEPDRPALVIAADSLVREQIVAVARDLEVFGSTRDAAVLGGSARIEGTIEGDLVVLGGDVRVGPAGRIAGDVFVFGGVLETEEGATVGGRAVAYPTAPSAWLLMMEGPAVGRSALSRFVVGAKLALLAAWLLTALALLTVSAREMVATSRVVAEEPIRCFFTGLVGVLAVVLLLVFLSAFTSAVVGVPLVILLLVVALLLKLWGTVAVFLATGRMLGAGWARLRGTSGSPTITSDPLVSVLVGIFLLGLLKILPWIGVWGWTVVTLVGVGATLSSKFGRLEPWIVDVGRRRSEAVPDSGHGSPPS